MKIDGRCHCGNITFEAEADPDRVTICHCTDCQNLTGSAFRVSVYVPAEHFVLTGGPLKSYIRAPENKPKRRLAFCGDCGTPIYGCQADNPQFYGLRLGTITQREALPPKRQNWRRSALSWVDEVGALPMNETNPTS
jgi:hypothetical protein